MFDLSLSNGFSVHLDDKNGIATVSERAEFEQAVAIALTEYLNSSVIGATDRRTMVQRLRMEIADVARSEDRLDEVENIEVQPSKKNPQVYQVRIVFKSDEVFNMEVSE